MAFTSLFLASSSMALADVISDWNEKEVAAGYTARGGNSMHSRNMAIVVDIADLEKAFWACDYTASVDGIVDAGMAIQCGIATEDLKLRKFNGDFNTMLSWWQQNKAGGYRALDRAYRAARHP
jgi:hypothetical protein